MIFGFNKEKKEDLLTEEDRKELMEIKRKSYMEEARKIMTEKGKLEAQTQLKEVKK